MHFSRRQFVKTSVALGASLATTAHVAAATTRNNISDLYDNADALKLAELLRQKQVSAQELLDEAIRRVELINPKINAVTMQHYDLARQAIQQGLPEGPFSGVPFLLKDLGTKLAGTVTSSGSRLLRNNKATANSTLVNRYQQAGLVIFGKTNTPEYGLALTTENHFYGDCFNPWNPAHSTGGSSGGAAAAVAAGILPVAHGTDGGGSIRVPAAHCGVFGFKPSRGVTPGVMGAGMSIGHVLSRSVRDSAAMLDATGGYEPGAPYGVHSAAGGYLAATQQEPGPLRIALNLQNPQVEIHPGCVKAVTDTAKRLEDLGHHVEEATPPLDFDHVNAVQNTLISVDVFSSLAAMERAQGKVISSPEIEPMTAMIMAAGRAYSQQDYVSALYDMHEIGLTMGRFMQQYDVILQPVTATPAPKLNTIVYRDGDTLLDYTQRFKKVSAFTHLYNMSGQPSMSLPLAMSTEGLPIGVMFSGRTGEDRLLFSLAAQVERAQPWLARRPLMATATG